MKTKEQLVEAYRHEFGGMIADVLSADRRGAELAMRLRLSFRRIDELLGKLIDECRADDSAKKGQRQ